MINTISLNQSEKNNNTNLFRKQIKVESREETKRKQGKHYVIGDIHGMYGSYIAALRELNSSDELYILGDVIDRGNGGIKIIRDIIERKKDSKNNPQITFLIGNHELLFLNTIGIILNRRLSIEDIKSISNKEISKKEFKLYYDELIKKKGITRYELEYINLWINSCSGYTTIFDFFKQGKEKIDIINFIYESYVVLPQKIHGHDYLFVHAVPPKDQEKIKRMRKTGEGYKISDLSAEECRFIVEGRELNTYKVAKNYGFTTICGHTPKIGNIEINDSCGYIRIDAGCGHKVKDSKLAIYCIEDNKVKFIDEMEERETASR